MGGQIAIHMAANAPARVNKLVLVSAAGIPRDLTIAAITRFVAEIVPPRRWGKPAFLPTVATDALRAGPRSLLSAANLLLRDDVRPLLPKITAPTLLVWGRLDPLTPVAHGEYMAQHITHSQLSIYEEAAHMPMVDAPARFNREVLSFLLGDGEMTG
jgi:pimeloyl-ACP methyl ester carboxylesterase